MRAQAITVPPSRMFAAVACGVEDVMSLHNDVGELCCEQLWHVPCEAHAWHAVEGARSQRSHRFFR